jgi:hypothetical protein
VFGAFRPFVDAILAEDETAPRKQRHTASQIYRRLVAEQGYTGKYDQVRRYLQQRRLSRRETFIPLEHRPGVRAEADFGHIYVDFPDGRRQVPVLIVTWSYSNAPFAIALPTERTEAILYGLIEAFAFFGCVPVELWWDNPKTVAIHLYQGRDRTLHPRYAALASHYSLHPEVLLAGNAHGEAPSREPRVRPAASVGHTCSPRERSRRVERPPPSLLPDLSRPDLRRQHGVRRYAIRAGQSESSADSQPFLRCLRVSPR